MQNLELFVSVLSAILTVFLATQLFGRLFTLIQQPRVVGEMFAGIVLGPTIAGYFFPELSALVFTTSTKGFLFVLSNIGLSIYMFIIGLELDVQRMQKQVMRQSLWLSGSTILIPFVLGGIFAAWFHTQTAAAELPVWVFALYVGTAIAITAFPMLARILYENGMVKSKLGVIALFSASIQDVSSWLLLSLITTMAASGAHTGSFIITLLYTAGFIGIMFFVVKPLLRKMADRLNLSKESALQDFMAVTLFIVLISAFVTDQIGLYSVFGGFVAGLIFPRRADLLDATVLRFKDYTLLLFLPLFFAYSGLNVNLRLLADTQLLLPLAVLLLFSFVGKYGSTYVTMRLLRFSNREASAIGGLMNARGLMLLIIANAGLMYELINQTMYSMLVMVAIVTTLAATPIFKLSLKSKVIKKRFTGRAVLSRKAA